MSPSAAGARAGAGSGADSLTRPAYSPAASSAAGSLAAEPRARGCDRAARARALGEAPGLRLPVEPLERAERVALAAQQLAVDERDRDRADRLRERLRTPRDRRDRELPDEPAVRLRRL